jgi:hypothetical protein
MLVAELISMLDRGVLQFVGLQFRGVEQVQLFLFNAPA